MIKSVLNVHFPLNCLLGSRGSVCPCLSLVKRLFAISPDLQAEYRYNQINADATAVTNWPISCDSCVKWCSLWLRSHVSMTTTYVWDTFKWTQVRSQGKSKRESYSVTSVKSGFSKNTLRKIICVPFIEDRKE